MDELQGLKNKETKQKNYFINSEITKPNKYPKKKSNKRGKKKIKGIAGSLDLDNFGIEGLDRINKPENIFQKSMKIVRGSHKIKTINSIICMTEDLKVKISTILQ